jgi:Na+/H+-dicarboxylate symporter
MLLSVRSRPSSIVAAWARVGVIAGACLGAVYGGIAGYPILPVQLMNVDTLPHRIWYLLVIPPSVASVLVAAFCGLRLPPAGRVADRDALVRIY